jgi:hypothetical protein
MQSEINNFRLKIRNTLRLKRPTLSFTVDEAKKLDNDIIALEKRITQLEQEALNFETLTVDIVGNEF